MLHAKFHDHTTFGSGEEVLKVFDIDGNGGHLGLLHLQTIQTLFPSTWNLALIGQAVSETEEGL